MHPLIHSLFFECEIYRDFYLEKEVTEGYNALIAMLL